MRNGEKIEENIVMLLEGEKGWHTVAVTTTFTFYSIFGQKPDAVFQILNILNVSQLNRYHIVGAIS